MRAIKALEMDQYRVICGRLVQLNVTNHGEKSVEPRAIKILKLHQYRVMWLISPTYQILEQRALK